MGSVSRTVHASGVVFDISLFQGLDLVLDSEALLLCLVSD